MILDEPTANLDQESARLVGEAIEQLRPGRTVLLVTHRPDLVRDPDRVVRLERGEAFVGVLEAA